MLRYANAGTTSVIVGFANKVKTGFWHRDPSIRTVDELPPALMVTAALQTPGGVPAPTSKRMMDEVATMQDAVLEPLIETEQEPPLTAETKLFPLSVTFCET